MSFHRRLLRRIPTRSAACGLRRLSSVASRARGAERAGIFSAGAVISGAVAFCISMESFGEKPGADTTGVDRAALAESDWAGRVGVSQYVANAPIEDRSFVVAPSKDVLAIGVLDGHGGWQVAEYVQKRLLRVLHQSLRDPRPHEEYSATSPLAVEAARPGDASGASAGLGAPAAALEAYRTGAGLPRALQSAFETIDGDFADLVRHSFTLGFGQVARVGACTLLAIVSPELIAVANAGDCRIVLGRSAGKGVPKGLPSATPSDARELHVVATEAELRRLPWQQGLRNVSLVGNDVGSIRRVMSDGTAVTALELDMPVGAAALTAWDLSSDHNARVPREQLRLIREHPLEPDIIRCKRPDSCYVKGRLQPTRSIGDLYLKHAEFNAPPYAWIWGNRYDKTRGAHLQGAVSAPYIKATPEVTMVKRSKEDKVLVAATDGLWDYLTSQQAVDIASAVFAAGGTAEDATQKLRDEVLFRAAKKHGLSLAQIQDLPPGSHRRTRHDDITVVVAKL